MTFLKINNTDYSMYCSGLKVETVYKYNPITNAAGNTLIDYVNDKRVFTISIIPLNDTIMSQLLSDLDTEENITISFLSPLENILENNVKCVCDKIGVEYYTIQDTKKLYKAFTFTLTEL